MAAQGFVLLNKVTADGSSDALEWFGGRGTFSAWGTFGAGTVTLQWSPDDTTTWINVDPSGSSFVTFKINGVGGFELPRGKIRANLSGSSAASVSAVVGGEE